MIALFCRTSTGVTLQVKTCVECQPNNFYNLITKRFISVFYPPAQWDVTTRTSTLAGLDFKTEGRVLVEPSWLAIYGKDNDKRLTGAHETAPIDKFSYGVANRGASIRIPISTEEKGDGYIEDRRPGANADPYVVSSRLMETVCDLS